MGCTWSCMKFDMFWSACVLSATRYLFLEKLKKEDAVRSHVFSSFFYKRLNQRERRNAADTSSLPWAYVIYSNIHLFLELAYCAEIHFGMGLSCVSAFRRGSTTEWRHGHVTWISSRKTSSLCPSMSRECLSTFNHQLLEKLLIRGKIHVNVFHCDLNESSISSSNCSEGKWISWFAFCLHECFIFTLN